MSALSGTATNKVGVSRITKSAYVILPSLDILQNGYKSIQRYFIKAILTKKRVKVMQEVDSKSIKIIMEHINVGHIDFFQSPM